MTAPPTMTDPESESAPAPASAGDERPLRDSQPMADLRCQTVAFASGKGGVGKSVIAASVGVFLAQLDKRVVLIDAAFTAPNLHTLVGAERPNDGLQRFFEADEADLAGLVGATPIGGLGLLSPHHSGLVALEPSVEQVERLVASARGLVADHVVFDLGAGCCRPQLELFLRADVPIVVTEPEPTAIESTVRWLEAAFALAMRQTGLGSLLERAQGNSSSGAPLVRDLRSLVADSIGDERERVRALIEGFRPRLLVNNIRRREDLDLGPALTLLLRRHLGFNLEYLGHVAHDDLVWATVSKRQPVLVDQTEAKISRDIERLARQVLSGPVDERASIPLEAYEAADQNHYEIMGLHATATEAEIRQAYRRIRRIYGGATALTYGVVAAEDVDRFLDRVELAYGTLLDPDKQQAYNLELFPSGQGDRNGPGTEGEADARDSVPDTAEDQPQEPIATAPMPAVDENTAYSGDLIRQVRQARGIALREVADRTKISIAYLRAIEDEDYASAPARVYLRGFVKSVARHLKLDPERVATSYIDRFDSAAG